MGARSTNPTQSFFDDFFRSGTDAVTPFTAPSGIIASGGVISDYEDSGTYYRAHVFTTSGSFVVSKLSTSPSPDNVEYLVVAGGGGGGSSAGGGGGAGGFRTNVSGHPLAGSSFPVSAQSYTVTVGGGGLSAGPAPSPPSPAFELVPS